MEETKEKSKSKIAIKVIKIIIVIILIPIIFVNAVIIIDSIVHKDEVPSFFGWKPFIVMSGSMEAKLYAGDLAIVKDVDKNTIKVGDIIAFQESKDFVVTHRIVGEEYTDEGEKLFITKGDNNNTEDTNRVSLSQIEGKYVTKIAKIGKLLLFIQEPIGTVIAVSIPIAILLVLHYVENKQNNKTLKNESTENESLKQEIERLKQENEKLAKKEDEKAPEDKETEKKEEKDNQF